MATDYKTFLHDHLNQIKNTDFLNSSDIPNIDLYMDQVTTFMDENLGLLMRNKEGKTLTKTMINNYSKAGILPPSNRKKYSKDHMLMLILIYNMKHVLSIPDIQLILNPLQELDGKGHVFETFFNTMFKASNDNFEVFKSEVLKTIDISEALFKEDNDILPIISTIYLLSMQAAVQKYLATMLIDEYLAPKAEPMETPERKVKDKPKEKAKEKPHKPEKK